VPNDADGNPDNAGVGAGGVAYIFTSSLGTNVAALVLLISAAGQFFCTTSCMTSASRMTFAFSRDGAMPGSHLWSKVSAARVPANAVLLVATIAALITLPALVEVNIGTPEDPLIVPVAFYAVVSVAVIGLYLAFLIPIWLRWRMGDAFQAGSWNNGQKYKWMNIVAVAEIAIISIYFILPFVPAGIPFSDDFSWKFVNYAPVLTIGSLILLAIWWHSSAKHWFTGPKHNIDEAVVKAFED
jgi:amino acid transporter